MENSIKDSGTNDIIQKTQAAQQAPCAREVPAFSAVSPFLIRKNSRSIFTGKKLLNNKSSSPLPANAESIPGKNLRSRKPKRERNAGRLSPKNEEKD